MRLSVITFLFLIAFIKAQSSAENGSENRDSEDTIEPPICTKPGILNVKNNIDNEYNAVSVPNLKFKTLTDLRVMLVEDEIFSANSRFQNPITPEQGEELEFSSINKKSERLIKACDILKCNLRQCTLFITNGVTIPTTTPKPDCSSASNGLITVYNIRNKYYNTIKIPGLSSKTLADLRVFLQNKTFFTMNNKFLRSRLNAPEFSLISREAEADIKSCEIISCIENESTLNIGHDGLKTDQTNIDRFLRSVRIDNSGEWKMSTLKIVEFGDNYNVDYKKSLSEVSYVTKVSSSLKEHYRNMEGVTEASLSLNSPFVSGSVSYENSHSSSDRTEDEKTYIVVRALHNKLDVYLKYDKLVLVKGFVDEMYDIIGSNDFEYQKALDLMAFLNRYGWYFPVRYTLGGSFRKDVRTSKMSNEKASIAATSFKAELQASFGGYGGGAGGGHSTKNERNDKFIDESSFTEITSVGACGATNIDEYLTNIKEEDNWSIVQYDEFVPTLLLLKNSYNKSLNEIIKIFRKVYFDPRIKSMQPNINIEKYITNIQEKITPVWT